MSDAALTWLRAQLDADERAARAAFSGQADPENGWGAERSVAGPHTVITPHVGMIHEAVQAEHVVRWNPARVLAEIEATRRFLDDYDILVSAIRRVDDVEGNQLLYARRDARMSDIRWLAQVYADRDGFPQEWR